MMVLPAVVVLYEYTAYRIVVQVTCKLYNMMVDVLSSRVNYEHTQIIHYIVNEQHIIEYGGYCLLHDHDYWYIM